MNEMHSHNEVNDIVVQYLGKFQSEHERQENILGWLERNKNSDLFARTNFDGHITTSAFIVDEGKGEMLLLKHKTLGKWFQPGGHTEGDRSLVESALREAMEETGIPAGELNYFALSQNEELPIDIDSHHIPANERKQEPGHFHHDFRYLFLYSGNRDNAFNKAESTGMKWVSLAELKNDPVFSGVAAKVAEVLQITL